MTLIKRIYTDNILSNPYYPGWCFYWIWINEFSGKGAKSNKGAKSKREIFVSRVISTFYETIN